MNFILSLYLYLQETVRFLKYLISSEQVQTNGLKYFFTSFYNIAVVLYRNKQMKEVWAAVEILVILFHCFTFHMVGLVLMKMIVLYSLSCF